VRGGRNGSPPGRGKQKHAPEIIFPKERLGRAYECKDALTQNKNKRRERKGGQERGRDPHEKLKDAKRKKGGRRQKTSTPISKERRRSPPNLGEKEKEGSTRERKNI